MRNAITKRKCQDEHSDARMWFRAGEGDEDSNPTVSVYRSIEAFAIAVWLTVLVLILLLKVLLEVLPMKVLLPELLLE